MDITRMAKMAQDFVTSTSRAVGNRTLNIMDTKGIIIASTNLERVGTFHQGAYEAVTTRQAVHIHSVDVQRYVGALEGCNTPIYYKGKIIGVVGIYGEPDEVADTSNLLNLYVTQFFEQNSLNLHKQTETEVRKQLMNMLFCQHAFSEENVRNLEDTISVHLETPCRIYIINSLSNNKLKKLRQYDSLSDALMLSSLINSQYDIYGIHDDRFVIIHSCNGNQICKKLFAEKLYNASLKDLGEEVELIVGARCKAMSDIASAYYRSCFLCRGISGMHMLDDPINKEQYLIRLMTMDKGKQNAEEYYLKLLEGLGESGLAIAMQTLEAYYSFESSITRAATALHIHKNTLLYRLNRI